MLKKSFGMKVLIDTNVLLDVLVQRESFYKHSALIWSLAEQGIIEAFISAISVNNIYYITRRLKDQKSAGVLVDKVLKDFNVLPLTFEILKMSRTVKGDYEDMIQYFSALQKGFDFIITRNIKDFPKDTVPERCVGHGDR